MAADGGNNNQAADAMGDLARDWITLWQSELGATAADPEMHEAWQGVLALWAGAMASMLRAAPREAAFTSHEPPAGNAGAADATRSPAAAAAPDSRDAEIERLGRHVAALERRLAELEHGGRAAVDPKRRRPRRA